MRRLASAVLFSLPLLALAVLWAIVVRTFDVDPRVFPGIGAVGQAGIEAVADGSLLRHVAASMWRVFVGTLIGLVLAIPCGVAMGVSPAISAFFIAPPS